MYERYQQFLVFTLLIIGLFAVQYSSLSIPLLDTHHIRQTDTASIIRNMQRYGPTVFQPMVDWAGPEPQLVEMELPLYNLLMCWVLNGQPVESSAGVFSVRLASFGLWVCMLAIFHRFCRAVYPNLSGMAVLIVALSPLSFVFSRTVQPDFLALFFVTLALERAHAVKNNRTGLRWLSLLTGWCALSLAIAIKGTMLFALTGLVPLVIACSKEWYEYLGWIIAFGVGLSWYWYAHSVLGGQGVTFGVWESNAQKWGGLDLWLQLSSWSKLAEVLVYCVWTPLGSVLFIVGLTDLRSLPPVQFRFIGWTVLGCAFGVVAVMDGFLRHEYYFVVLLPLSGLVIAHGVGHLKEVFTEGRVWQKGLVCLLLGTLSVYSVQTSRAYIEVSQQVDEQVANQISLLDGVLSDEPILMVSKHAQSIMFHADVRGWRSTSLEALELDDFISEGLGQIVVFDVEEHATVIQKVRGHSVLGQPQYTSAKMLVWDVEQMSKSQ